MTHPLLKRAHLEALVVARVLLDPALSDAINEQCLSPAANVLLDAAVHENTIARATLKAVAVDEFQARLAERVEQLTFPELAFWPADVLVRLVNALPVLGARSRRAA